MAYLFFILGIALLCTLVVLISLHVEQAQRAKKDEEKVQSRALALALSPQWQAHKQAEHQRQLDVQKLELERAAQGHKQQTEANRHLLEIMRFEIESWQARHIIEDSKYIINADVDSVHEFPSLKSGGTLKSQTDEDDHEEVEYPPLSLRDVVDELPYNELAFAFGTVRSTGRLLQTTLPYALHTQITGSSGQGKSVESSGILTQLCTRNDADHLHFAFLDCEGETTAPFRTQPHVRYQADTPDQAARTLHTLVKELDYRDQMRAKGKLQMSAILVFIEEFLSLKRVMSPHLRNQALDDFTELAIRGRKRFIFLMTVGQTAYSEKATRDAQRQFQSILTFAMPPAAARAAGMTGNSPMLNQLWTQRQKGQFLLQAPISNGEQFVLAPRTNEQMIQEILAGSASVPGEFPVSSNVVSISSVRTDGNQDEKPVELDFNKLAAMREMIAEGLKMNVMVERLFSGMQKAKAQEEYYRYLAALVAERRA